MQLELSELIEAVRAASTKEALEELVKAQLGIDLDKRRRLPDLRDEVLRGLGVVLPAEDEPVDESELPASEPVPANDAEKGAPAPESEAGKQEQDAQDEEDPALELPAETDLVLPDLGPTPKPPAPAQHKLRLLKNTENGREFAWSPDLAKLPYMKEV